MLIAGKHPFNHPSGVVSVFELIKEGSFECPKVTPGEIEGLTEDECKWLMRMLQKEKSLRCNSSYCQMLWTGRVRRRVVEPSLHP